MSLERPHLAKHNRLLAALPAGVFDSLAPDLERISLELGQAIYDSGRDIPYVYFPTTAIISLISTMRNGASAEIAVTGNDGIVGIALFMGGATTTGTAVVQSAGISYRLSAKKLIAEFSKGGEFQHLLLRFAQALITQMIQTAACNRHHSLVQQLCRWLLLSLDLLPSNELVMTQELISNMLGVRRAGVSLAAAQLQAEGIITYRRGHIIVHDRSKLEAAACECYAVVKSEVKRLLPQTN